LLRNFDTTYLITQSLPRGNCEQNDKVIMKIDRTMKQVTQLDLKPSVQSWPTESPYIYLERVVKTSPKIMPC